MGASLGASEGEGGTYVGTIVTTGVGVGGGGSVESESGLVTEANRR